MKSISSLKTLFGRFSRNTSAVQLALGLQLINDAAQRRLYGYDYTFLEITPTILSVDGQQTYPLPVSSGKVRGVSIQIGDYRYVPQEAPTREMWDKVSVQNVESNIPLYFYIENNTISFYPTLSGTGNVVRINMKKRILPATNDDYVTGTLTFTSGSAVVTLTGGTLPTWIAVNGYVITEDGTQYEISTRDSDTQLTMVQLYDGDTNTQTTEIVQGLPFPDGLEYIPLYDALSDYYLSEEGKESQSKLWSEKADELVNTMNSEFGMKSLDVHLRRTGPMDYGRMNPNNYPTI